MRTVIFDFETNDLLENPKCQPIEFACMIIDEVEGEQRIREQNVLIKCVQPIAQKAYEAHGIDHAMLEEKGIEYNTFLGGLHKILWHPANTRIITHNGTKFDIPLAERITGLTLPKSICFDTAGEFKGQLLGYDMPKIINLFPEVQSGMFYNYHLHVLNTWAKGVYFNLKAATQFYETPTIEGDMHRAIVDVKHTYEVYKKQMKYEK